MLKRVFNKLIGVTNAEYKHLGGAIVLFGYLGVGGLLILSFYQHLGSGWATGGLWVFVGVYLVAMVFLVRFSRAAYEKRVERERLQAMRLLVAEMAHQLRTPMAAMSLSVKSLGQLIPSFFEAYMLANKADLLEEPISRWCFEEMKLLPDNLDTLVHQAIFAVDSMVINLEDIAKGTGTLQRCSMKECLKIALKEYPLIEKERFLFKWDMESDFAFMGKKHLMVHVLFNLIKNGLYSIKKANKGEIIVNLREVQGGHCLHFRDTGSGMADDVKQHVFELFYTKKWVHGTGLGLTFCREVMKKFQGGITCYSKEGNYTEFILSFPKCE